MDSNIVFSRWQSFCAICTYISFTGTLYAFNIYGALLKTELGYSQSTLNIIANVGNSGNFFAVLFGFGIEQYGCKNTVYFGSMCIFIGYFVMWLATIKYLSMTVEFVTLFYFISQSGICCFIVTAITSTIKLFPAESRGTAIGLCRAYFGLSSAVLGDLAGGVFASMPTHFLLFVSIAIPVAGILGVNLSSELPPHLVSFAHENSCDIDTSLTRIFYHWNYLFCVLFVVGYSQYSVAMGTTQLFVCSLVVVLSVLVLMVLPGTYGPRLLTRSVVDNVEYKFMMQHSPSRQNMPTETTALIRSALPAVSEDSYVMRKKYALTTDASLVDSGFYESSSSSSATTDPPVCSAKSHDDQECFYGASLTLEEAIVTWRYWALFTVFLVICGSGLLVIYNASDIAVAAGSTASTFYVTVFALGNGMGKVVCGIVNDWAVKHRHMSTLQLLALVSVSMAAVHLLLTLGWSELIFGCFFWIGMANGGAWSLVSVSTTDMFGPRYIATTLAVIDNAPMVGSYFFTSVLIAVFYKVNAVDELTDTLICVGSECFRMPFLICAAACIACALLTYYMHLKTDLR